MYELNKTVNLLRSINFVIWKDTDKHKLFIQQMNTSRKAFLMLNKNT